MSEKDALVFADALEKSVVLLSPAVPHIAEELWEALGHTPSVVQVSWPEYDEDLAREEEITIVVQVNGKVRSRLSVDADAEDDRIRELALADDKVKKYTDDKDIRKVVVVPKKLVNIVVA